MTTARDITIYQGQEFTLSLDYAGATGRAQVMHIRLADSTATVVQILTHNGAANSRVIYNDATQKLDITIGATVSDAWVVLADRVEWVFDIKDYEPGSEDGAVIPYRGKVILRGTRTRPSDVTPSPQMPSGDGRYTRFDGEQNLTPEQMAQAQINILGEEYSPGAGSGDVVGPAGATDDRIAAFDSTTGKLIKQGSVTATAVAAHLGSTSNPHSVTAAQAGADASGTAAAAVVAHTGATDPHGDRAYADGLAVNYATAGHNHAGVYQPLATVLTNTTAAFTTAQESKLSGIEAAADVTDAGNVGAAIDGASAKTTPADADTVALIDSAAANVLKKLSWANIKATLKTYFDAIYQAVLVSGTNIKTVNSTSLLGSGDIAISGLTGFTAAESTSSPNATVPVASLTANNAATNVDAALRAKGTGAVLAQVPDGATTGGNKRGASAVDWQAVRGAATQVASGLQSTLCGGGNNTASGVQSVVVGGYANIASGTGSTSVGGASNTVSGPYAVSTGGVGNIISGEASWAPGGKYANTRSIIAAGAYGMINRVAGGDRQTMVLPIACAARTDATPTVMTSDAGAASATNQMVLPNNSAYMCTVEVVAFDPGGVLAGAWEYKFLIKRGANAASTAIVGTPALIWSQNGLSGGAPGIAITADTTNGCPKIEWTGIAATTTYPSGHITARQCA